MRKAVRQSSASLSHTWSERASEWTKQRSARHDSTLLYRHTQWVKRRKLTYTIYSTVFLIKSDFKEFYGLISYHNSIQGLFIKKARHFLIKFFLKKIIIKYFHISSPCTIILPPNVWLWPWVTLSGTRGIDCMLAQTQIQSIFHDGDGSMRWGKKCDYLEYRRSRISEPPTRRDAAVESDTNTIPS